VNDLGTSDADLSDEPTTADDLAERFRREAATDRLFEEVAFVAYYFGWAHETVLNMPNWERRRWCEEISRINERANEGGER
jgi:hypothetical protein